MLHLRRMILKKMITITSEPKTMTIETITKAAIGIANQKIFLQITSNHKPYPITNQNKPKAQETRKTYQHNKEIVKTNTTINKTKIKEVNKITVITETKRSPLLLTLVICTNPSINKTIKKKI
jgi:hypothetical protein